MPAQDHTPPGAPCWIDLITSDTGRARSFYSQLLGWTAEEPAPGPGGYFLVRKWDLSQAGGSSGGRASATRHGPVRVGVVAGVAGCGQVAGVGGDGLDCDLVAEGVQALDVGAGLAAGRHA